MFSIVITEKGGAQRQLDFEGAEIGIGRLEDNDLCLPKNNVSKYHARLVFKDERYVIVDQKSTNGTYVNGRRISAPMVVRKGDKIYIGDFILTLAAPGGEGIAAREFRPIVSRELRGATIPTKTLDPALSRTSLPPSSGAEATVPPTQPSVGLNETPHARTGSAPPPAAAGVAPARAGSVPPPRTSDSSFPPARAASNSVPPPPLPKPNPTLPVAPRANPPPSAALSSPPSAALSSPPSAASAADPRTSVSPPPRMSTPAKANPSSAGMTSPAVLAPSIRLQGALAMLMERLATRMNVAKPEESAFPSDQQQTLERLIDELASEGTIGPDLDRRFLREAAMSEAVGLGPLDRLLANRAVREIVVDGPTRVLADLGGGLTSVSSFFSDDSAVLVVARRLFHRAGQKIDTSETVHEGQLPGGGLLQLLLPPLSPKGPLIAVRCPPRAQSSPESLVTDGVLSNDMLALLRASVQQRKNIVVLGPLGAGVSGLLSMLTMLGPDHERVVSIEDSPSATLLNSQVLPLSRKARPEASLAEFLHQASQLRYDRLLIDDLRSEDVLTALSSAAATSGVLLGVHAPDPSVALTLLELFGRSNRNSIRPLMAAAIDLLVHLAPDSSGQRRILSISQLKREEDDKLELRVLYRYDGKAFLAEPKASGVIAS